MMRILRVQTRGRGWLEVTADIQKSIAGEPGHGLCHLHLRHTSASLLITENADPSVRADLERWMARAVTDGDPLFSHDQEGPDDMPAHVRSVLAGVQLSVPYENGRLLLGTWQGIYLWEHRHAAHTREIVITALAA